AVRVSRACAAQPRHERRGRAAPHGPVRAGEVQPARAGAGDARRGDRRAPRGAGRAAPAGQGGGRVRQAVSGTVVATLALVVALAAGLLTPGKVLAVYVLVLAAIAIAALTRSAREASEWHEAALFDNALRRPETITVRPPDLVRMEREITLGSANVAHLESRLLPILRDAAAARLAARHNVELARRPETARSLRSEERRVGKEGGWRGWGDHGEEKRDQIRHDNCIRDNAS